MLEYLRNFVWYMRAFLSRRVGKHQANDIMIFSVARSGSTWLKEIIASQKNIKFIEEPLRMNRVTRHQLGVFPDWKLTLPCKERDRFIGDYFKRLLSGDCAYGTPLFFSDFFRWRYNRVVLKLLRGQDLMNWFEQQFSVKIVYLIRHPIAVALSRQEYDRLHLFVENERFRKKYLNDVQFQHSKKILANGSELEKKVLDWVFQNLAPLKFLDRKNWICVHYEDIVTDPDRQIQRLTSALALDDPKAAAARLFRSSQSTHKSDPATQKYLSVTQSKTSSRAYLVEKWLPKVGLEDRLAVQEILDLFNINIYCADQAMPILRLDDAG